jgi:hypothetical protein
MADKEKLWGFIPANTFALITPRGNNDPHVTKEEVTSADIVDVLHAVPGKRLDKTSKNSMEWTFVDGQEERGLIGWILFKTLGIQWIGLYRTRRTNLVKEFVFGRDENQSSYIVAPKDKTSKDVFFSGSQAVIVPRVEMADALGLTIAFITILERTQPVKSVMRVADSNANLSAKARKKVLRNAGTVTAQDFIGGPNSAQHKEKLEIEIRDLSSKDVGIIPEALQELGLTITSADLEDVDYDATTKALLQQKTAARIAGEAKVIEALADRDAKFARIEAETAEVNKVILPQARTAGAARIREAMAYEKNSTVRTFAPGGRGGLGIITGDTENDSTTRPRGGANPGRGLSAAPEPTEPAQTTPSDPTAVVPSK